MKHTLATSVTSLLYASAILLSQVQTISAAGGQGMAAGHVGARTNTHHRRHHVNSVANNVHPSRRSPAGLTDASAKAVKSSKRTSRLRNKRACKAKSTSSTSTGSSSTPTTSSSSDSNNNGAAGSDSNSTSSSSSSSSGVSLSSSFLSKNGIYWGYLPDEADAGGSKQTMAQLNQWSNTKSAFYGYYAQAPCSKTFDGSQLMSVKSDIISSGAIFQPAVMPTGGFSCFTSDSSSNAYAIAKVMKEFTDEGVEVWLRPRNELFVKPILDTRNITDFNYISTIGYLQDGTYQGDASGFISAWKAVAGAIKEIAPDVKMFWTPNIENDSAYAKYWPGADSVDIVGIDYYPSSTGTFVDKMQSFHDTYAIDGVKFAIGETGWGKSADIATRLAYVEELTSDATKSALPNYVGCAWFNFYKGYDFRIVTGDDSTTQKTVSFFSS